MPIHLLPRKPEPEEVEEEYYEEGEYCEGDEYENVQEDYEQNNAQEETVLVQELLPEKPKDWETMSKTQKKNYRRKYNAQRERMEKEGVTENDFAPSNNPHDWSEERRMAKLNAVKARFPLAAEKQHASRFDYASLLNIVCQKCRINLPEFKACASDQGGFAYECRVGLEWYKGWDFCTTKKDAKHEAAKWALLGMEVPGIDNDKDVGFTQRAQPMHPRLAEDLQKMREADEVGKLMAANMYDAPKKNVTPLRQPRMTASPSRPPTTQSPVPQRQQQQQQHQQQQPQHQQQQQQQPPQQQQQPRGWGQPSRPPPGFTQPAAAYAAPMAAAAAPSGATAAPSRGWGATASQQQPMRQVQKPPQPTGLVNGVQNLNMANEDFPSLGGAAAGNAWSTVTKKGGNAQGVNKQQPQGGRARGRGRGRGTTMKLS